MIAERYNAVCGTASFDTLMKDYADAVQSHFSEILIYKPKLSSK